MEFFTRGLSVMFALCVKPVCPFLIPKHGNTTSTHSQGD